jgi:hypothetical protein
MDENEGMKREEGTTTIATQKIRTISKNSSQKNQNDRHQHRSDRHRACFKVTITVK